MIAIAGPLTIANQALTAALGSRNAMIATYLAQDGMESIKNIKDNNGTDFLANLGDVICTPSQHCQTPTAWSNGSFITSVADVCDQSSQGCKLYVGDTTNYTYSSQTQRTPFTRYYYLSAGSNDNERVVTVVVDWNDGSIPNEIKLQELMTNTPRI